MISIASIRITCCGSRCGGSIGTCTPAGSSFRLHAQHYLVRRQREPGDVYAERLSRVFYENYIGSIVDWYAATLFRHGADR